MATRKNAPAAAHGGSGAEAKQDGKNVSSTSTAGLEVTSKTDGFRRAGMIWSRTPKRIKLSDLTDEQEALLRKCPGLTVTDVDMAADSELA